MEEVTPEGCVGYPEKRGHRNSTCRRGRQEASFFPEVETGIEWRQTMWRQDSGCLGGHEGTHCPLVVTWMQP